MAALRRSIGRWGDAHRRDLPWRRTRDPWRILVSEVMLQQTQAARVVPRYLEFVERFPTPTDAAAAGAAELLRAWEGLGYHRRAVNLHASARVVVQRHRGRVPGGLADLLALPGVGAYTARAVLAFAFERPTGVVDTNVGRVLARGVAGRPLTAGEAQALADRLVPGRTPWAFNQSMMDLGALTCTARHPDCPSCPWRRRCAWRTGGAGADPARTSAGTSRPQPPFAGSDREGRGRLVAALRSGPLARRDVPVAAGWAGDPARARRVAKSLVADGVASVAPDGSLVLG
ncbi:MAG TPA: A/G-specific adenine glycosylase [Acidimicrobiales bacterium]|nr:A/G-specific adenine glycosylase [Acidimicrobiales bacterium]